jgi:predicted metal-dependent hydrolase
VKTVELPDIGQVQLIKHAQSRSIRLTIAANGTVKITLPRWAPYQAGLAFAQSKRAWILDNQHPKVIIKDGSAVGKFHHLYFKPGNNTTISTRQKGSELWVSFPDSLHWDSPKVQDAANKIAIRAMRGQAESLLPQRLRTLASKHDFEFKSVSIRQLKARWGSCNSKKEITLNLFLMQLPWELIDYVLLHELTHTKALHHGPDFWAIFEAALPGAKRRRKLLRDYKPEFEPA